jgi:hypothetical protein
VLEANLGLTGEGAPTMQNLRNTLIPSSQHIKIRPKSFKVEERSLASVSPSFRTQDMTEVHISGLPGGGP